MSGFWKGVLAVFGALALAVGFGSCAVSAHSSQCTDWNYKVYTFQRCVTDPAGHCFIEPADIEAYSRALTDLHQSSCVIWKLDESRVDN